MYDGGAGGGAKRSKGETAAHRVLKRLSLDWLVAQGCRVAATEVRLPLSPYRVDAAGYRPVSRLGVFGDTFALECKQSRADFLRDAGLEAESQRELEQLRVERDRINALMMMHLPACRCGISLFAEYDAYDFSGLRHERWRRLVARLDLLERRLETGVKFSRIARYGSANFCYLVVEADVLRSQREIPLAWGCLQRDGETLKMLRPARRLFSRDDAKLAYLERLAAKKR